MNVGSGNTGAGGASASGLAPNVAGALSYVLGLITGIVFMLIEKDNQFVRFHAYQSIFFSVALIALNVALTILGIIIGFIPVIGVIWAILSVLLSLVIGLGGFIAWIMLIIKAYQGERWKLPYVGDMAERYAAQAS